MSDKFTCNLCEKETDVGYFYCPKCHELHKKPHKEIAVPEKPEREDSVNEV